MSAAILPLQQVKPLTPSSFATAYPLVPASEEPAMTDHLQAICEIAADLFDMALVAVMTHCKERGWELVSAGRLALLPQPAEMTLALKAIATDQPLVIPDTVDDKYQRYQSSEPGWRMHFFAAFPLNLSSGQGALCLLDRKSRELSDRSRDRLQGLANVVASIVESEQPVQTFAG